MGERSGRFGVQFGEEFGALSVGQLVRSLDLPAGASAGFAIGEGVAVFGANAMATVAIAGRARQGDGKIGAGAREIHSRKSGERGGNQNGMSSSGSASRFVMRPGGLGRFCRLAGRGGGVIGITSENSLQKCRCTKSVLSGRF